MFLNDIVLEVKFLKFFFSLSTVYKYLFLFFPYTKRNRVVIVFHVFVVFKLQVSFLFRTLDLPVIIFKYKFNFENYYTYICLLHVKIFHLYVQINDSFCSTVRTLTCFMCFYTSFETTLII